MQGTVKWFNPHKGYGFITGEDGNDYFAHYSNIQADGFRTLKQDAAVSFDVETDDSGRMSAKNIVAVA